MLLNLGGGALQSAVSYMAGRRPTSVAAGDLNNDGYPDLAVSNGASPGSVSVLLNAADWTPSPNPSPAPPMSPVGDSCITASVPTLPVQLARAWQSAPLDCSAPGETSAVESRTNRTVTIRSRMPANRPTGISAIFETLAADDQPTSNQDKRPSSSFSWSRLRKMTKQLRSRYWHSRRCPRTRRPPRALCWHAASH
jgi:hypothetical protein